MRGKELLEKYWLFVVIIFTTWLKFIYFDRQLFSVSILPVFIISTFVTCLLIYGWTILFDKYHKIILLLTSFFVSLLLLANNLYFRYFGSIVKFETLTIIKQTGDITLSINSLFSIFDVLYFIDILILIIVFVFIKKKPIKKSKKERMYLAGLTIILSIVIVCLLIIFDFANLKKFTNSSFDNNLVERRYGIIGAHSLNIFRYLFVSGVDATEEEKQEVVAWIKDNKVGKQKDNDYTKMAEGKDIYLIQIESLQSFTIGMEFEGEEVTPNLNNLVRESNYFPNGESPIGGGLTSDSDFMANTSLHALSNSSAFVTHGSNNFTSLPKALEGNGYSTNTFHAFKRDFWNRGVAFNSLGFDHFYAQDEYDEGENIILGLNDESFYEQTLEKIPKSTGPNFNYIVSLSSHHPFDMAEKFQLLKTDLTDDYNYRAYHYLQAIRYADYSLGIFLDGLKNKGKYDGSLIIVYGDHPAKFGDMNDPIVRATVGNNVNPELVPYIYKLPNQKIGQKIEDGTKQIDIMPTVLNLTGVKTSYPMFGRDVFGEDEASCGCILTEDDDYSEALIKYNLFDYFY